MSSVAPSVATGTPSDADETAIHEGRARARAVIRDWDLTRA